MRLHEIISKNLSLGGQRRRQPIKAWCYPVLLLLVFLTACSGYMAFAGEKKTLSAPVRVCVHWFSRSDSQTPESGLQIKRGRGLLLELKREGWNFEKKSARTLWHI
jgi:hypothetical protein